MALDDLRAELERLYELDEMVELSRDLLGFDPARIGGTAAKGSFARALLEWCTTEQAIEALADAVVAQRGDDARRFGELRANGFATSEELANGDPLGPYVIIRKIGEGRTGISYLAEHDGREVRLKVLRRRATLDRSALQRFLTATRLQAKFQHAGIPSGISAGPVDERWAVTHDAVDGRNLSEELSDTGALPFTELRAVARSILEPLSELHARRLAHGALSLGNVVVTSLGKDVVLLDAGSYLLPSPGSKTAAPELVQGRTADARSDVYTFGALLFELLTGKSPFIEDAGRAPPGHVSRELDELMTRMLDKDPARRPRNASVVLDALDAVDLGAFVQVGGMPDEELDALLEPLMAAPDDEQAASELEAALGQGANPKRVAEALRFATNLLASNQPTAIQAQRRLLLRAAKIYEGRAPDRAAAEEVLTELVRLEPEDAASEQALLRVRRQMGKWTEVVEMLLEQSERATTRSARGRILAEIGKLYANELDDRTQALVAYAEAVCQDPEQVSYAAEVERLAGSSPSAWNEALELCVQSAAGEMPADAKKLLWLRMAHWYADKVNRPDLALSCHAAVLSTEPTNDSALEGMSAIYRTAKKWSELGAVLIARADATENPALARDLRAEAAGLLERELGQVGSARDLYERIIAADPSHAMAGEALTKIYENTGDHASAVRMLERRADAVRGQARHALLCRAAELFEGPLNDPIEAVRRYEAIIAEDPADLAALRGLDRAHAKIGDWDELLRVLDEQLNLAATPRQKASLWQRIAGIYGDQFFDPENAVTAWEKVLELEPQNQDAYSALPEHYRALDRHAELADLYQRHLRLVVDPKKRVEIGLELGRVLGGPLGSTDLAISAYEDVLEIENDHPAALESLAVLRAASGDSSRALEALDALATRAATPAAKAEQYMRAARLLEERGEIDLAIERYKLALDAVPKNTDASHALRAAYVARGDAKAAVELIEREIGGTEGARARGKLYGEMARLCWAELGDEQRAEQAARLSVSDDPTNLDALTVLGDLAFDSAHFLEAAKQYQQVTNRLDALDPTEAARVIARHAQALAKSGTPDKALEKAEWLLQVAPGNPAATRVAANLVFEHGDPRRAFELYDELAQRRDDRSHREQARLVYALGESARRLGELEVARERLEEAIELDSSLPLSYRALAKIFEAQHQWSEMARVLYGLLDVITGEGRVALLIEIGDLVASKLKDTDYAAQAYLAALYESPNDRKVLMKLMQLYGETEDWNQLLEVIQKLAELIDDHTQKAKYLKTAGEIAAKQLGDTHLAIQFLDRAVELDPGSEGAIEEALREHRSLGNAQDVKRLLKQRIKLAVESEKSAKALESMGELAELYLQYFADVRQAVAVYEAMQELDSSSLERTEVLANLYASRPAEYFDKAVASYQRVLAKNPYHADAYRALRRLYTDARFPDGAWCLCQALALLGLADAGERDFFERLRVDGAAPAREPLSDADWATLVAHADTDPLLTNILTLIQSAVIAVRSRSFEALGYRNEHLVDPARHASALVQSLAWGAKVLGMELPPLFHNANDAGGLSFLHASTPSIVLGRAALETDVSPQTAAFIAGQQLASFRPGHYVRHLLPTGTALKSWLLAAVKLIAPQFPVAAELERPIQEALSALENGLTGPLRDHLASIVSRLLQQSAPLDLKKWVAAADLTADRAGLILCHDLETAVELVRASRQDTSSVPASERIEALVRYSVSAEYFSVRARMGVAVK